MERKLFRIKFGAVVTQASNCDEFGNPTQTFEHEASTEEEKFQIIDWFKNKYLIVFPDGDELTRDDMFWLWDKTVDCLVEKFKIASPEEDYTYTVTINGMIQFISLIDIKQK